MKKLKNCLRDKDKILVNDLQGQILDEKLLFVMFTKDKNSFLLFSVSY